MQNEKQTLKSRGGVRATCNPDMQEAKTGIPGSSRLARLDRIDELWVQRGTPPHLDT